MENEQLSYRDNNFSLSTLGERGVFGFLEVKRIPLESIFQLAHDLPFNSSQFVALNTPGALKPEMGTLRAFIPENGDGAVIGKGVWHWTPFALAEKAAFAWA